MSLVFGYVNARKGLCRVSLTSFIVFGVLALPVIGAEPKRTFTLEGDIQTSQIWRISGPRLNAGYLIGHDGDNKDAVIFYTIDREGRRDEFLFTLDGSRGILIDDFDIAPNGEAALLGGAYASAGHWASFVARISADRRRQTVTKVWPYCPKVATIAPDGSIWTIGRLKNEDGTRDLEEPLVRRYDASGKMLDSARVQVVRRYDDLARTYLRASLDRVSWLTIPSRETGPGEYVEFSLDGKEIGRYDGPEEATRGNITGLALSKDNDVVAGITYGGRSMFVALDRPSRAWIPVSLPGGPTPIWSFVLGFDESTLVTMAEDGKLRRFKTK